MNILWVENHQRFSQLAVKSFLVAHDVTVIPSVAAARQRLSETRFDLVMVDYDLDDGKGTELVRKIVNCPSRPPIIATSSHILGNQALLDAGADVACSKMDFANIERVLAAQMDKQQAE